MDADLSEPNPRVDGVVVGNVDLADAAAAVLATERTEKTRFLYLAVVAATLLAMIVLVESVSLNPYAPATLKSAAPNATRAWVRRPGS